MFFFLFSSSTTSQPTAKPRKINYFVTLCVYVCVCVFVRLFVRVFVCVCFSMCLCVCFYLFLACEWLVVCVKKIEKEDKNKVKIQHRLKKRKTNKDCWKIKMIATTKNSVHENLINQFPNEQKSFTYKTKQ